jgi:hypothetical protein
MRNLKFSNHRLSLSFTTDSPDITIEVTREASGCGDPGCCGGEPSIEDSITLSKDEAVVLFEWLAVHLGEV